MMTDERGALHASATLSTHIQAVRTVYSHDTVYCNCSTLLHLMIVQYVQYSS